MGYESPDIAIIPLESADIVRTSGKDVEWDNEWNA